MAGLPGAKCFDTETLDRPCKSLIEKIFYQPEAAFGYDLYKVRSMNSGRHHFYERTIWGNFCYQEKKEDQINDSSASSPLLRGMLEE